MEEGGWAEDLVWFCDEEGDEEEEEAGAELEAVVEGDGDGFVVEGVDAWDGDDDGAVGGEEGDGLVEEGG